MSWPNFEFWKKAPEESVNLHESNESKEFLDKYVKNYTLAAELYPKEAPKQKFSLNDPEVRNSLSSNDK